MDLELTTLEPGDDLAGCFFRADERRHLEFVLVGERRLRGPDDQVGGDAFRLQVEVERLGEVMSAALVAP
ncbi:MAG: hypothetical protein U1E63_02030 [Burkholderiales bacterium]